MQARFALSLSALLLLPLATVAQEVSDANPDQTIALTVSKKDHAAVAGASGSFKHIFTPKPGYGIRLPQGRQLVTRQRTQPNAAGNHFDLQSGLPYPGYYPADVSDYGGGPVVVSALNYPIFVNTTPKAVGDPGTLLRDLGESDMVHVIDQYIGVTYDNRYRPGLGGTITYPVSGALYDADITAILHAAASSFGKTGYHAVYHLFFAPGQDVCSEGTCYSPDNPSTFSFCAYHDSMDFTDIGHVLYTVMPFQAVDGCQTGPPSPNGLLIDSQMDSLSHEFFETITDPDGTAWWNQNSLDIYGDEIADECVTVYTTYPIVRLNGKAYELQGDYSNRYHGCSYQP